MPLASFVMAAAALYCAAKAFAAGEDDRERACAWWTGASYVALVAALVLLIASLS
jgi:uncharacterized membrane protein SpoIIM required for sporulation